MHLRRPKPSKDYAREPARQVPDAYKAAAGDGIYHAREALPAMVDLQAGVGFSILSVGPGIDIEEARKTVGDRACLSGNVDPIAVLARGTIEAVRQEVERIIKNVSRHGGHVMNSGEMVPRQTPEKNVHAFVETARNVWETVTRD